MSRVLVVVTGASKGFGRAVATQFAQRFPLVQNNQTDFILVSRALDQLESLKSELQTHHKNASVETVALDLSDLEKAEDLLPQIFSRHAAETYKHAVLVNNAGFLSPNAYIGSGFSRSDLQHDVNVNIGSFILLTDLFLKHYDTVQAHTIVNVSSAAEFIPFKYWSTYCAGKAARAMFLKVAAEEAKAKNKEVRCVNYAPGVLDTEMQAKVRRDLPEGPERDWFIQQHQSGSLVAPETSAQVLIEILVKNDWENASTIEYNDYIKKSSSSS